MENGIFFLKKKGFFQFFLHFYNSQYFYRNYKIFLFRKFKLESRAKNLPRKMDTPEFY